MTAARYRGLKRLSRAEFHACRIRRHRQGDVARNLYSGGGGFCGIRLACGRDLRRGGRRQICWCCIDACRRNGSGSRISPGNAVDTPAHARIRGIRHHGGERELISEHDRAARRRHAHCDRWRRWWRQGDCASSAAAQCPCSRREKSQKGYSLLSETLCDALRKGPHVLGKAGEGPAKQYRD